jgi:hypothetical protein
MFRILTKIALIIFFICSGWKCIYYMETSYRNSISELTEFEANLQEIELNKPGNAPTSGYVHATNELKSDGQVSDSTFGIQGEWVALRRIVETYQWERLGNANKYTYSGVWSKSSISSAYFDDAHKNSIKKNLQSLLFMNKPTFGSYRVQSSILKNVEDYKTLNLNLPGVFNGSLSKINELSVYKNAIYTSNPMKPNIGDTRVRYEVIHPGVYSIIGEVHENELFAADSKLSFYVEFELTGSHSSVEMLSKAQRTLQLLRIKLISFGLLLLMIGSATFIRTIFRSRHYLTRAVLWIGLSVGIGLMTMGVSIVVTNSKIGSNYGTVVAFSLVCIVLIYLILEMLKKDNHKTARKHQ